MDLGRDASQPAFALTGMAESLQGLKRPSSCQRRVSWALCRPLGRSMTASPSCAAESCAGQTAREVDAPETAEDAFEKAQDATAGAPAVPDHAPDDAASDSFSSPGVAISSQCKSCMGAYHML